MNEVQLKIRLPKEMKERLEMWATANSRSLTAEIVHRLRLTLPDSVEAELADIKAREADLLRAQIRYGKDRLGQLKSALRTSPVEEFGEIRAQLAATEAVVESLQERYESALDAMARASQLT